MACCAFLPRTGDKHSVPGTSCHMNNSNNDDDYNYYHDIEPDGPASCNLTIKPAWDCAGLARVHANQCRLRNTPEKPQPSISIHPDRGVSRINAGQSLFPSDRRFRPRPVYPDLRFRLGN